MQEVRKKLKKYRDLRISVRNVPSFNIGGGNFEIDFSIQGPSLEALERYTNELASAPNQLGGIVDADTTLRLDRPELRVVIDRERAADLGVRTEDIATALRLMVGGDDEVSRFRDANANENYDVQLRLIEADRGEIGRDQPAVRAAHDPARTRPPPTRAAASPDGARAAGQRSDLVRLDNLVRFEQRKSPSRIDRLDRQRVSSLRAGVAPGYALADRLEALRGAVQRDGPAAGLHAERARARRRARAHVRRVHLGVSAVDRADVHDPGVAVREPGPPVHDPARAAAVGPVRAAQPVGDRQHAEPVLGARAAGAVRRREEELDPAGRSHEQAARRGHAARARRSCRPTATGCARS